MNVDGPSVAAAARAEVRRWLTLESDAVGARIARIGQEEVSVAAATAARLDAVTGDGRAAATIDEVRRLVEGVHAPAPRRWLGMRVAPLPLEQRLSDAAPLIAAGLDRLARDAERLARQVADARAVVRRLSEAAAGLDAIAVRLGWLERAAVSAERELRADDAGRSAFLRDEVPPLLAERLSDIRTQQLVVDQGRLSLKLLMQADDALLRAIDRARHQTVPALRTAVAAVRALDAAGAAQTGVVALEAGAARAAITDGVRSMRDALGSQTTDKSDRRE